MSTLEFRDCCGDNYDTAHIGYFWDAISNTANWNIVSGISGMSSNCLRGTTGGGGGYLVKNLSSASIKSFHARLVLTNVAWTGYTDFLQFWNTGALQISIRYSSSGSISAWCGATKLCESATNVISSNAAFTVAGSITFSSTATGNVTIQVNGVQVCSTLNVITTTDSTSNCNQFVLFAVGGSPTLYYDDIIVDTGTTSIRAPQKNIWLPATGAGRYAQMTAVGAASNYLCVTDTTPEPDDDTTYVKAATAGLKDAYTLTNPNISNMDAGVQTIDVVRTDDGGAATITPGFSNGTTDASGTAIAVPSSYQALRQSFDTNPITSAAWSASDLATLQKLVTRSA